MPETTVSVKDVLELLSDQVLDVVGDTEATVTHPAPLDAAGPDAVTFCKALGDAGTDAVRASAAGVTLAPELDGLEAPDRGAVIRVRDPRLSFLRVVRTFFAPAPPAGVHPTAVVAADAQIDVTATVGPFCVVGDGCVLGPESVLHPHVTLAAPTRIGARVTIHAGSVIGADGFGYQRNDDGMFEKFPHVGGVVIEDDVEIGANTCVDRGTLGDTILREGAKVDNLVHIAHNVDVGRHTAVIANAMIGGSVRIGDFSWVAPSATVINQAAIGDRATVGLSATVVKDVADGSTVMGMPARPADEYKATLGALKRLGNAQESRGDAK